MAGSEEGIQQKLGEMSRKLTLLQINERKLVRKQELLQEVETGLRKVGCKWHDQYTEKCWFVDSNCRGRGVFIFIFFYFVCNLHMRHYSLLQENSQLLRDRVRIEKAVTEKIAYLQRHKVSDLRHAVYECTIFVVQETSLFKLSSLQQQLSDSVSCEEMDKANKQYSELAIKYQQLLSQQAIYTITEGSVEKLEVRPDGVLSIIIL